MREWWRKKKSERRAAPGSILKMLARWAVANLGRHKVGDSNIKKGFYVQKKPCRPKAKGSDFKNEKDAIFFVAYMWQ